MLEEFKEGEEPSVDKLQVIVEEARRKLGLRDSFSSATHLVGRNSGVTEAGVNAIVPAVALAVYEMFAEVPPWNEDDGPGICGFVRVLLNQGFELLGDSLNLPFVENWSPSIAIHPGDYLIVTEAGGHSVIKGILC